MCLSTIYNTLLDPNLIWLRQGAKKFKNAAKYYVNPIEIRRRTFIS